MRPTRTLYGKMCDARMVDVSASHYGMALVFLGLDIRDRKNEIIHDLEQVVRTELERASWQV